MDEIQKPSNLKCYVPLSETFRNEQCISAWYRYSVYANMNKSVTQNFSLDCKFASVIRSQRYDSPLMFSDYSCALMEPHNKQCSILRSGDCGAFLSPSSAPETCYHNSATVYGA